MTKKILPTKFDDNQLVPTKTSAIRVTSVMQNTNTATISRKSNNTSAALKSNSVSSCTNYNLGDNCFSFCSNQDVFVNITENITEQKYIKNIEGAGALCAGTINSSNVYTNVVNNVCKLGFDTDSGFEVTDLGSGLAKIGMNSTFKYWEVNGNPGLVACGLDTVNFVAGSGITITSDNSAVPKSLTISSTSNTNPGGCNTQFQYNNSGSFAGASGLTYDSATCSVGISKIAVPQNQGLQISVDDTNTYWYSLYGDYTLDTQDDYASQVTYDSQGNIYIIGADGNNGIPHIVKYDPSGTIIWQKIFTEVNNYYKTGDAVAVDSNDDVYCMIGVDDSVNNVTILKLSSLGVIIWQTTLTFPISGGYIAPTGGLTVDNLGNVFAALAIDLDPSVPAPRTRQAVVKLNSTGTLVWTSALAGGGTGDPPKGIEVDSTGNIVIVGQYGSGLDVRKLLVVKFDTNGNIIWQKQIAHPDLSTALYPGQLAIDSSDNIYIVGLGGSPTKNNIIKLSSSGNLVWQTNVTGSIAYYGITVDSSNNVYAAGYGTGDGSGLGGSDLHIIKLNSAGVSQWQRAFSGAASDYQWYYWGAKGIDVINDSYTVTGYTYTDPSVTLSNSEALTIQFPTDGSLVGNYGNFVYIETNFTTDTSTYNISSSTAILSTVSLSSSAGGYSVSTGINNNFYYKVAGGSNTIVINQEGRISNNYYTLPLNNGLPDQVLTSNTSGDVSWCYQIKSYLDSKCSFIATPVGNQYQVQGFRNVSIGGLALCCNQSGSDNIALGYAALKSNTTGYSNVAIGDNTLVFNTAGSINIALGTNSMVCNTAGNFNVAIGFSALRDFVSGSGNIAIGMNNSRESISGVNNISIGSSSLFHNGTDNNIAIGPYGSYCNTTGTFNVSIGSYALYNNTIGECNVAIGGQALQGNTTGWRNIAIGKNSALNNTIGGENNAIGYNALSSNTTGSRNFAIGSFSLYGLNGGNDNVGIGIGALRNTSSGCFNVAIGIHAGCCNQGNRNTFIGNIAGASVLTGNNNTIIGNLYGSAGLVCTVLIGAGTCERIKVDNSGLCVNGTTLNGDGLSSCSYSLRIMPQNSQSANYTLVAADSGRHILHPSADTTARTFTIPANSSVAYPIGTAITFVNQNSAGTVTISITSDIMRLAGAGTTGNRTLVANGVATAIKITSTEWIISGVGLT